MYVNGLRKAKKELKDERNCALVQAGEANAICELRQEEYEVMKKEIMQKRPEMESLRVDSNFLKEKIERLSSENENLKVQNEEPLHGTTTRAI